MVISQNYFTQRQFTSNIQDPNEHILSYIQISFVGISLSGKNLNFLEIFKFGSENGHIIIFPRNQNKRLVIPILPTAHILSYIQISFGRQDPIIAS